MEGHQIISRDNFLYKRILQNINGLLKKDYNRLKMDGNR